MVWELARRTFNWTLRRKQPSPGNEVGSEDRSVAGSRLG